MKKKIGIIVLFVFQGLAIPFALFAGFMLLFSVTSLAETNWSEHGIVIQSIVAITTMLIGVSYVITYSCSLIKTINNKKLTFISWLPTLHCIIALSALFLWNYFNQLYK